MGKFRLKANFKATPDQQKAIDALVAGVEKGKKYQTLLGVTGSGKTFSVANVIERLQQPALIISHNKTLAAQLYQEFRDFFPTNAVSYFVSYYDYYQPEAYIPSTDTYIEKDAGINELIDKLRLAATANILTRPDTIVVSSVSCIYNIGSPVEYEKFVLRLRSGLKIGRDEIINHLLDLQYDRGDFGFHRGTFRVRGDSVDVFLAYQDEGVRIEISGDKIAAISSINPVSGSVITKHQSPVTIFPSKHYVADTTNIEAIFKQIKADAQKQTHELTKQGKLLEAQRLSQRVEYDLEMIREAGYVKGIENYSRYFDGRAPGEAPYSLLDYFTHAAGRDPSTGSGPGGWLVFADESHITFPQIRGMYAGDLSRKKTLIEYGFRLPAALDNRPLKFDEFMRRIPGFIATSATPAQWELSMSGKPVEQLLRPTGIPDPEVEIRPVKNQVSDVIKEIKKRANPPAGGVKQRSLVTTLTKATAEDLADYLAQQDLKVHYLHSGVKTLDRGDILDDLRSGKYDCLVGINLLREGLDLPEVSLVAILDADKEGFLRSDVTLIQNMGRAARHVEGRVILYADRVTGSMKRALSEVKRRRKFQLAMNKKLGVTPKPIKKPIREKLIKREEILQTTVFSRLPETDSLTPMDKRRLVRDLNREMRLAASDLNFELAAEIRDKIKELETS